jgi:uncharacterized membrane protein YbhN (UPF0104 family)
MKHLKRIPRWLISSIFFGLIIIFLVVYVRSLDWNSLTSLSIDWLRFSVGTVCGLLFLFIGAFTWRVILRALGATSLPPYRITTAVYAKAWMGRYIPGTVTWIAGKIFLASGWGISKSRLSVASLLEGGSQVLALTFIGFLLLGTDPRLDAIPGSAKIGLIILGLMVLIVLLPPVFNRILGFLFKLKKKNVMSDELRINSRAVSRSFGLYAINGLIYGVAAFFVIWSLAPDLSWHNIWYVTGVVSLATVAGMAAPFAPSGIGIKDGLQLVLLSAILPRETALAATILTRLWSVVIDLLFLAITVLAARTKMSGHHA